MRGLSTLYLCACEKEGCLSNSELVRMFAELDQYSPSDDVMEERQKHSWMGTEVEDTATRGDDALAHRACPTVLDFTQNYLGDAGLAALFRVLPLMRWVKKIVARNCGASQKSVKALCDILTMELPTVFDSTKGETIGIPLIALECVDLRDNPIFVASGRMLVKALDARRRVQSRHTTELPPMEVLVDFHNLPCSISVVLEALNRIGYEDKKHRELDRKRQQEREQVRLFCVEGSALNAEEGLVQPTGENIIYRIPEYMPNTSDAPNAEPILFYDSTNPHLARLVREINQHIEDYLVAFKCLSKRIVLNDGSGGGDIENARAAAQLCVELGADTLSFLPFTNAALWFENVVCRNDPITAAALAMEEQRRTNNSGRLSYMPSLAQTMDSSSMVVSEDDRRRLRECDEKQNELTLRYAEINANVSSLLRGFYANPHLEQEVIEQRGTTLNHYIHRLKELFYEGVIPQHDPEALAERMQMLEALYNRVVAALTTKSMADLPSMRQFEERLADIRLYMVDEMLMGTAVEDLMRLQKSIRQELIPPVPYEVAKWIVDARSSNLPPPLEWKEDQLCLTDKKKQSSPYRRVWPLWCTQMKYFLFNHTSHRRAWNKEYVPKERRRWVVPPPQSRYRRRYAPSTSPPNPASGQGSVGGMPPSVSRGWSENNQTPYRSASAEGGVIAHTLQPHPPPPLTPEEDDEEQPEGEEDEPYLMERREVKPKSVDEDEEEYCYEEEEEEEDGEEGNGSAVPPLYRSLVLCTCHQRLAKDFPERPSTSARRTCLPRPCPACCYASLAILPEFLNDPLMQERLQVQEKVRDALPMEIKVFFLDMILRRRSRSAYVPRVFGVGTRLRKDGSGADDGSLLPNPHTRGTLPTIPPRNLVSIMDFFAVVDGKRERMMEVLSAFEEWYRLKMVESFDVAYPYLARPRFGKATLGL